MEVIMRDVEHDHRNEEYNELPSLRHPIHLEIFTEKAVSHTNEACAITPSIASAQQPRSEIYIDKGFISNRSLYVHISFVPRCSIGTS